MARLVLGGGHDHLIHRMNAAVNLGDLLRL